MSWLETLSSVKESLISAVRIRKQGRKWLTELHTKVTERHRVGGEVAYLLERDWKDGLGGLRDIHAVWWANAVGSGVDNADLRAFAECNEMLLRIRPALHHNAGRSDDVLHLQDQGVVAEAADFANDDALMATLAAVGRQVMWISEETWSCLDPPPNRASCKQPLAPRVALINGEGAFR